MIGKSVQISVIVPALNEQKYIRIVLFGLGRQAYRNFEVVVVDGNSRDRTREIAKPYGRVIVEKGKGVGRARNSGARIAKGSVLVFLDADTKPSEGLLSAYAREFRDPRVVAATGPILPLEETTGKVRLGYRFVSVFFVKLSIALHRPTFIGSNFAVRKGAFEMAGGFNERFITYEDWDLSARLQKYGRMIFANDAVAYTSVRRVRKWGMARYFFYYMVNMFRHRLFKSTNRTYAPVR